jgi:hypothetical protein
MQIQKRKALIPLLFLGLVLGLASLSVAYGMWSETLNINGTVHTGTVDGEWTGFVGCYDFESKDVATTSGTILADPHYAAFTITNGYPGYVGGCQYHYRSTGTVPVHVEAVSFTPGAGLTNCSVVQSINTGTTTATCDQLKIKWTDGLCSQLHQGDEEAGSFDVWVLQPAPQNASLTFQLSIQLVQYNESQCP